MVAARRSADGVGPLLGGLSPAAFLRVHWQKRPLLVRQAIPGFRGIVARDAFLALATRLDARSRLVIHHPRRAPARRWERHDGPFGALEANMLPARGWTLLVNSVESLIPGGWEILRRFSFLPAARIDDLMISYAADGGSVGPHDDRYDVFLLQGLGRRRWQVSRQRDRALDPDAAIKVLRAFVPEDEWVLEPGDMLYLPPGVAHHGVAEGPCFTYSIGFLAASHADVHRQFFSYLGELLGSNVDPTAMYQDADLTSAAGSPHEIGDAMVARVAAVVGTARWSAADVADFLGRFLTSPKPQLWFAPPARPLDRAAFARRLVGRGGQGGRLALALPSRGLVRRGRLFLNGEAYTPPRAALPALRALLADRALPLPLPHALRDDATLDLLHTWYTAGFLFPSPSGRGKG
ncbi:MAG TPA: cupin domain-containing protein [Polyangia bacterium]|jgi:50S ribosomal protein L16 3-hydroxylase